MTSTATTSNPFPDVSPPPDTTYLPIRGLTKTPSAVFGAPTAMA